MNSSEVRGEIYSYTRVYEDAVPSGFEEFAPLLLAMIMLENGVMMTAQLTDVEMGERPAKREVDMGGGEKMEIDVIEKYPLVNIGDEVEMVTRLIKSDEDRGIRTYGYKFRPVIGE